MAGLKIIEMRYAMMTLAIKTLRFFFMLALLVVFLIVAENKACAQFLLLNSGRMADAGTGLEWAADAGTPSFGTCNGGEKTWQEAVDYVRCLNVRKYLGHGDWRVPSAPELSGLISKLAKAYKTEHQQEIAGPKLKEIGFKNIRPSLYWSSAAANEVALAVDVSTNGRYHPVGKWNTLSVWPVRGGKRGK